MKKTMKAAAFAVCILAVMLGSFGCGKKQTEETETAVPTTTEETALQTQATEVYGVEEWVVEETEQAQPYAATEAEQAPSSGNKANAVGSATAEKGAEESRQTTPTKPQSSQTTKPKPTEPAQTKPAETKPAETKPAETKPVETKPAETKPAETKPAETKPAETKPAETKPAEQITTEFMRYQAMSPEQQQDYYLSFGSPEAFFQWYAQVKAEHEAFMESQSVGGNASIDLGDLIEKEK